MDMDRRTLIAGSAVAAALVPAGGVAAATLPDEVYGLIGNLKAVTGKGDALAALLVAGSTEMPGCHSYVVARDRGDPDLIWITELWDSKSSHDASLSLPQVRAAIASARPLIAGGTRTAETHPVGGPGLRGMTKE